MPTFRHSGEIGDIIYSLRCVQEIGNGIVLIDYKTSYPNKGPLGKEKAKQIVDLIQKQNYIIQAKLTDGSDQYDYDLDKFRKQKTRQKHLVECHWYALKQKKKLNLSNRWLVVDPKPKAKIIISISARRSRYNLDWSELYNYKEKCLFLGFENEWKTFCNKVFKIKYYKTKSLLDVAKIISGANLFIGNQSFGFSLAEAMKVNRVLEVCKSQANCMPQSNNGHTRLNKNILKKYIGVSMFL